MSLGSASAPSDHRPLPTRFGVGASCVALPPGPWATIAQCLQARFPRVGTPEWDRRMAAGEVVDEHGVPVNGRRPHRAGLRVYYYRSVADEPAVPFRETVLYRDDLIVVADKPHFLAVTPGGAHLQETLLVRLKRRLGVDSLVPVHRIDRETAGVVMFALQGTSGGAYQRLFAQRLMLKTYECIAPAREDFREPRVHRSRLEPDTHFMRMREVPGEPNAETRIEMIERRGALARYRLTPLTGRRHQLRVHCAALGMPIVGDGLYPLLKPAGSDDHRLPLQLLARSLSYTDPITYVARCHTSARCLPWSAVDR